ncbi:hypothetical protein [Bradyrhizobium arachidis]|uniref:hypothetical protein n=1 Tax=Bradyrhizobium arachidis TaxID=858423 RepID=UPI00216255A0|nr:hypothetical protein [Bradyrhizobium arachidis]
MIEQNRELAAQSDAAASISTRLDEGPEFDAADEITGEREAALRQHLTLLIRSKPTTMAGVVALSRYVASIPAWRLSEDEDGWHQAFLRTLADAMDEISRTEPKS